MELLQLDAMKTKSLTDHIRYLLYRSDEASDYEPVNTLCDGLDGEEDVRRPVVVVSDENFTNGQPLSWIDYFIFLLLGIIMLWAWLV